MLGVEDACVANDDRLGQPMAQPGSKVSQSLVVGFNLAAFQGRGQPTPSRTRRPATQPGMIKAKKVISGPRVAQQYDRLDVHPGEGIERQFAGLARELEMLVGHLFDRQLAGRQCRQYAAPAAMQRPG